MSNPWDSFKSAPYAFLYKEGTEMALKDIPKFSPFVVVSDGRRFVKRDEPENNGFLCTDSNGVDSWVQEDANVVIDDRLV